MSGKVKLITDSGCDIPETWENRYKIDIMPFSVMVDDREYWERTEVKPQDFYKIAEEAAGIPKTNQIIPVRFEEKFLECYEEGYDDVIVVLINSSGSKTYENAVQVKAALVEAGRIGDMQIHLVDSKSYSVGYGFPVVEAAKKIKAGDSVRSIIAYLDDWFGSVEIILLAFDLKFLRKSGRCSAVAGFVGELMGIKPVITIIDGETMVVKKARGDKNVIDEAVKLLKQRRIPETPWMLLRSTYAKMEDYAKQELTKITGKSCAMVSYAGAAVASNGGTRILGLAYKGKKRR
ncbi:MAG: DegV family protein [Oscillospiraceae bacterium]|nr:DegV family protein [Oscillospiraceae bacterium]